MNKFAKADKLLAVDLDHTVLNSQGELSQKNAHAITLARKNGFRVVIFTGRSPAATQLVWKQNSYDDYAVCFGGALTLNMRTQEIIEAHYLSPIAVAHALDFANKQGLDAQLYLNNDVIAEYENINLQNYVHRLNLNYIIDPQIRQKHWENIPKVLYYSPTHDREYISMLCQKVATELGNEMVVSASSDFIEMNKSGCDKGTALLRLCDFFGISSNNSVAIGDSLLDVPMITAAHIGVAVANGSIEARSAANILAPNSDSDALLWLVENLLENDLSH